LRTDPRDAQTVSRPRVDASALTTLLLFGLFALIVLLLLWRTK
jgi:hypothetical protein